MTKQFNLAFKTVGKKAKITQNSQGIQSSFQICKSSVYVAQPKFEELGWNYDYLANLFEFRHLTFWLLKQPQRIITLKLSPFSICCEK